MKLLRFLKYERPYLVLSAAIFALVSLVYVTDPVLRDRWDSFSYAFMLYLILITAFTAGRYFRGMQVRRAAGQDREFLSLDAELLNEEKEQLEREHIFTLNEIHAKQREHYDFIVSWFHEVKTPISVLRLMQQTEVDPAGLEQELSRIEQYVDQALYYAKLDSFTQDYELVHCDLVQLVKTAVKRHSRTFISKKIRLVLNTEPVTVQSDAKWLQYIIDQLLTNSLKYTEEQGTITITSMETADEKQLMIRDNGIGIEAKDLPRVFNKGFTGSNGRTHMKSTGMGLYLAQELSQKLGHFITCTSETGRFTECIVHFPKFEDPYTAALGKKGSDLM
ncbi:sensor histidine kinase [Paenibacillus gansuensis]|uniref:histidine kinase n=1 Tax=Paenibacillus gansuensis TaxID=306542 RepID=A0ABW5PIX6_9BACL